MQQILENCTQLETGREVDEAAWLQSRADLVGSSEIATVMQVSKWQTPLELWCQRTGKVERRAGGRAARYGRKVEPLILELFAEDHPELEVLPNQATFVSKRYAFAAATPDSFTVRLSDRQVGITEVKHAGFGWDEWGEDKAPTDAHIQTVWQMGVMQVPWAYIAAVVGGRANDPIEPRFDFDEIARNIFEQCLEKAAAFLACVRSDTPPGAGPGDLKLINQILKPQSRTVILPQYFCMGLDLLEKAERKIEAFNELLKEHKKTRDTVLAKLLLNAGGAKLGILPDGRRVKFVQRQRSGYTVQPKTYWEAKIL